MTERWFRVLRSFGSGGSVLLFAGGWVIYYVTIAVWSKEALSRFMAGLNDNIVIQVITFLFLISFLVYIIRTALQIVRNHKWALPFWLLLPVGICLFLTGGFLNGIISNEGKIIVGEGDPIQPPWEQASVVLGRIDPGLKDELLGADSPESAIFQYEPTVVISDSLREYTVRGFPPTKIGSTYYHILDFGLAPGIRVSREREVLTESHVIQRLLPPGEDFGLAPGIRVSQERDVLIESYVIQRILPPGKMDSFFLGDLPYRVEMRIAPSRIIQKRGTEAPVYNLQDLHFTVLVYRGESVVYEGPADGGVFFDGMELEFTPHIYWVRLEAAQRPGMLPLVLGISLIVIGFPFWLGLKIVHLIKRRRIELE